VRRFNGPRVIQNHVVAMKRYRNHGVVNEAISRKLGADAAVVSLQILLLTNIVL
jgi:hypothetical protein